MLLAILWPVVGYFAAGLVVGGLLYVLSSQFSVIETIFAADSPFALILNAILSILVFVLVALPLHKLFFGTIGKKEAWGLHVPFSAGHISQALLAYGLYFVASAVVIVVATQVIPGFNIDQEQNLGFDDPEAIWQLVILFVSLVVVPPVMEELIFRGFMFGALRRQISFWPAALIVSAVFGFVHGQWNVGVDTFVLSIFLCWLREHTGSLWPAILLHAIKNGVAFTLLFIVGIA